MRRSEALMLERFLSRLTPAAAAAVDPMVHIIKAECDLEDIGQSLVRLPKSATARQREAALHCLLHPWPLRHGNATHSPHPPPSPPRVHKHTHTTYNVQQQLLKAQQLGAILVLSSHRKSRVEVMTKGSVTQTVLRAHHDTRTPVIFVPV